MAKIHGIAYVIFGIILSVVSFYINKSQEKRSFILFFYIGILMVIIGLIKLIFGKKEEKPQKRESAFSKYCSYCGNAAQAFDQFCSKCGNKLFHKK